MCYKNHSTAVIQKLYRWGFGGIAKVGAYYHLPHNFVIDFFIDYSFLKVGKNHRTLTPPGIRLIKADVSGAIFGVGLGYKF